MNIDLYERISMWGFGIMLALLFGSLANAAFRDGLHPPSHVETIDPSRVMKDPRFATQGVRVNPDGRVHAWIVGLTFAWLPVELRVPAGAPVTFHLTSVDVTHGFQIVRTNGQSMIIPGYISQFTTRFTEPGEYLVACNEYCGLGHHTMAGKLIVVPRGEWTAPATATMGPTGASHEEH